MTFQHARPRDPATRDAVARVETVALVQISVAPGARATAMLKQSADNMHHLRQRIVPSTFVAGKSCSYDGLTCANQTPYVK